MFQGEAGATVEVILGPNLADLPSGERVTLTLREPISGATLIAMNDGALPLSLRTELPATRTY